jgi:hypothetical protein
MADTIFTDGIEITRDEAVELMAHHLRLAAKMFEATPDTEETRIELIRLLSQHSDDTSPECLAGLSFYDKIYNVYERMKDEE